MKINKEIKLLIKALIIEQINAEQVVGSPLILELFAETTRKLSLLSKPWQQIFIELEV